MPNVIQILHNDCSNGDGIRVSIWIAGCTCKCKGCYSVNTWNFNQGFEYTQETEDMIIDSLSRTYIKGISISGGNPVEPRNLADGWLIKLVKRIKEELPNKTIYCWSGRYYEDCLYDPNFAEFIQYVDMLRDGPYMPTYNNLRQWLQGSTNQRYVDCKRSLEEGHYVEYSFGEPYDSKKERLTEQDNN